jgi:hypothetical protein
MRPHACMQVGRTWTTAPLGLHPRASMHPIAPYACCLTSALSIHSPHAPQQVHRTPSVCLVKSCFISVESALARN